MHHALANSDVLKGSIRLGMELLVKAYPSQGS